MTDKQNGWQYVVARFCYASLWGDYGYNGYCDFGGTNACCIFSSGTDLKKAPSITGGKWRISF